ncbi:MAG: BREX-1 system adenine-specific DNA-methyltransferase PglX [Pirellulaceae bacterium]
MGLYPVDQSRLLRYYRDGYIQTQEIRPAGSPCFHQSSHRTSCHFGLTKKAIAEAKADGDVVIINGTAYPKTIGVQRENLVKRIKEHGFQQTMEAAAYTWFNRFAAIRFMEVNEYLDHGYRVLSHVDPSESRPEILLKAEHVDFGKDSSGKDIVSNEKVIELKLDGTKDEELYRMLLLAQCAALNRGMPSMFESIDSPTQLLMPGNLLHSDSLIQQMVEVLTPEACETVETIGWLYQFYISEKKDDVFAALKKGKKITPENIPAATQLFTPHWIVRYLVENSLGRLWMLNHPDSRLIEQMDYYIRPEEPETDFLRIAKPEEIKVCDPACGSGHMLTYAFDLLYAIYEEQGYQATDIPRLILTHNLYGIEIDQRAGALAAFALTMKAREKYRRFLTGGKVVQPNICVLENIQIDPEDLSAYMDKVGRDLFSGGLQGVVNQWEEADNFGSLIRPLVTDVSEVLELLRERQMGEDLFLAGVHQKVLKALRQADYLSPKYHVVVANPPYMGSKGMDVRTKEFATQFYKKTKSDLFAMFVERILEFTRDAGVVGLMTPFTWMFLGSYKHLRETIVERNTLTTLVRPEYHAFFESAYVPICAFVLVTKRIEDFTGVFFDLNDFYGADEQPIRLREAIQNPSVSWRYLAKPSDFDQIPGSPIAYWVTQRVREIFTTGDNIHSIAQPRHGMSTGNNDLYLRRWSEVAQNNTGFGRTSREEAADSNSHLVPGCEGWPVPKWYGNNEFLLNYGNNGHDMVAANEAGTNPGFRHDNQAFYFRPGISWSTVTVSSLSMRYFDSGFIIESKGSACYAEDEHTLLEVLGYANSKLVNRFLLALSPTLDYHEGPLGRVPFIKQAKPEIIDLVSKCLEIARNAWDGYEQSWDFQASPLIANDRNGGLDGIYTSVRSNWNATSSELQAAEIRLNELYIDGYGLSDEVDSDVPMEEVTLDFNPKYRYDEDKSDSELEALLLADTMREFISYAVGCMLGRYSLDKPGLILANQGETADDYRQQIPEPTFAPDEDNVIPLLDGDWFEDDITERFKAFLKVTFGTEHYEENLTFLENSLFPANSEGKKRKTIRDYFLKEFYNHHIKLYKKRPIYWLFSSGKQGGFRALIYMHRYNPSTLSRMRTAYVVPLQGKYNTRIDQLEGDIPAATSTSHRKKLETERSQLIKQRDELQAFDEKLRHYADQRIEIDLDDGVKVNYGKFGDLLDQVKAITGNKPEVEA